jgi:hypothetical protein
VAAEDLSIVIAKLLENPEPHFGRRIQLSGPITNRGSWKDHYELASKVVGKPITFNCVPIDAWAQEAAKEINSYAVQHLSMMAQIFNRGGHDHGDKSKLDEFIPREQQTTVEQFFTKNKHLFEPEGLQILWGQHSAK